VVFLLCIAFTVYPLTFYCGWIVQNFIVFQFSPQTLFLDNLVLIKEQLILNTYENVGLKEREQK
jgi:hypothetical protein